MKYEMILILIMIIINDNINDEWNIMMMINEIILWNEYNDDINGIND